MLTAPVLALLRDVLDPDGRGLDEGCLAGAAEDMVGRIRSMPRYMGIGIATVTRMFGASGYPAWPRERRLRALAAMRGAPVGLLRDYLDFFEKMGTFVYYSRVEHELGVASPPE